MRRGPHAPAPSRPLRGTAEAWALGTGDDVVHLHSSATQERGAHPPPSAVSAAGDGEAGALSRVLLAHLAPVPGFPIGLACLGCRPATESVLSAIQTAVRLPAPLRAPGLLRRAVVASDAGRQSPPQPPPGGPLSSCMALQRFAPPWSACPRAKHPHPPTRFCPRRSAHKRRLRRASPRSL
jgi:hypothetical protein